MSKFQQQLIAPKSARKRRAAGSVDKTARYRKIASMENVSRGIINELYSPIDATNRFINLALQAIGDNSQGRQFLLESKQGIRKTAQLLKKLNDYTKEIEKELKEG